MASRRLARLNGQLRREITAILHRSVRDPRVRHVIVNSVEVTSDLWVARVYVSAPAERGGLGEALQGLEAAAGFIRRELAAGLHIHRIPELRFLEDRTLASANRVQEILKGLEEGAGEGVPGDEQGAVDGSGESE